jgi:hypothetical protein
MQPGVKGCTRCEVFEAAIGLHEHVLRSVLGILSATEHVNAEVVDSVLVFLYKVFEGRLRVALEEFD